MADGTVGVGGLPPGRYTFSGSFTVGLGPFHHEWVLPKEVPVDVGKSTIDVQLTFVPAMKCSGTVVNPSNSLRAHLGQQLAVFGWKDEQRSELLGACPLIGDPKFSIESLAQLPPFLSVEAYPQGAGFRGPVFALPSLREDSNGYVLSVP